MTNDTTLTQLSLFDVEVWRPVVGYEDTYVVSNYGRVMRIVDGLGGAKAGRILKHDITQVGYARVTLAKQGTLARFSVHRLVATTFIGTPTASEINHIDGNKLNNHVGNLEYCTSSHNKQHAVRMGLKPSSKGEQHGMHKVTRVQVDEIRRLYATGDYTQKQLGEQFGLTQTAIGLIVRCVNWK